ncbi:MAG: hypothetical protein CM1200mP22_14420 [Dehalococcoidia bacterium]|nr:MAG: hypothetical protein CM1200mP22_14420 [Dehalococcoidia bacterium]
MWYGELHSSIPGPLKNTGENPFEERGVPIVGDDIKSQLGATITHRVLTRLFEDRGVTLDNTYQLNFGGNTDSLTCWKESVWFLKRFLKPLP